MKPKVTALVLSGGGNCGALQVGALQALLEYGLAVDMLVGTSAGALNAAFLAADPSLEQVARLADTWRKTRKQHIYPGNRLAMIWRVLRGRPSFFPNHNLRHHLLAHMPSSPHRFAQLDHPRLYVVATRQTSGALRVFGDDPQEKIIDALMASTAMPPMLPPWCLADECLIDGGLAANLPVSVAIERGATDIWAVQVVTNPEAVPLSEDIFGHVARTLLLTIERQMNDEIERLRQYDGHLIQLRGFEHLPAWDYSHTDEMIAAGYHQTCQQLDRQPQERPARWRRLAKRIGFLSSNGNGKHALRPTPQGVYPE